MSSYQTMRCVSACLKTREKLKLAYCHVFEACMRRFVHSTVSLLLCCRGKVKTNKRVASLQALSRIRLHRQPRALTLLSLWLLGLLAMWMPAPKAIDGPALEHYEAKLNEAAAGDRAETLAVQAWWQAQAELEAERTWFWFLVRLCTCLCTQTHLCGLGLACT